MSKSFYFYFRIFLNFYDQTCLEYWFFQIKPTFCTNFLNSLHSRHFFSFDSLTTLILFFNFSFSASFSTFSFFFIDFFFNIPVFSKEPKWNLNRKFKTCFNDEKYLLIPTFCNLYQNFIFSVTEIQVYNI